MTLQPTLLISALFALAGAGIYGFVGWRLARRVVSSPEAQRAWRLFTVWWFGLAATTLVGSLLSLAGAFGLTSLPLLVALTYLNLLLICVALWGLLYYLIYLFTGSSRWFVPLTAFYIAYYILLVYYITVSDPSRVQVGRWSVTVGYGSPVTRPFSLVVLLLLVLPQIIGSLAYFTLYFRVREATQKYRILLVSWSIILWFGSAFAASVSGLAQRDWWQIASRFIGLAAALTIFIAYVPPGWLKRRYGLQAIGEEVRQ